MNKVSLALVALLFCSLASNAQTKKPGTAPSKTGTKTTAASKEAAPVEENTAPTNLVLDASFEIDDVKLLKAYGQLPTMIKNWGSPNESQADLFNTMAKSPKVAAPKNDLGTEEPFEGSGYGGFRAFTKDPKKTRTYMQARLTRKLTKDKLYCVKFNVSLSDLSKWGASNVGMFISDRKVQNANTNALTFQPQITEKTNAPVTTMSGWETICGTYLATGREEYIIIGCFGVEADIKLEKVIKPTSQEGMIMPEAYYYIDNVEVLEIASQTDCFCGKKEDKDPDLIYSRASAKNVDMKPAEMVKATSVWFSYLSAEIPSMFEQELLDVAKLLQDNPTIKLDLVGHSDNDEQNETKTTKAYIGLAQTRAEAIKKFLTENGVDASRISVSGKDNTVPATDKTTPLGKAQNRRVEFSVK
jgi:outer membrane protein OmpA-like peptidoglycan-associated protein